MPLDGVLHVPPQRMAGEDCKVAANVGDDSADRPATNFGGDFSEAWVVCAGGVSGTWAGAAQRGGGARLAVRRRWSGPGCRSGTRGEAGEPCFQRLGAKQATGYARQISARSLVPKLSTVK